MIILRPINHTTIWGGSKISKLTGNEGEKIGHLYSIYCRDSISNEILNGVWKGRTLNDVFPIWKVNFHMEHCDFFPLTIALTDANENLSMQVHPDDHAVNKLEYKGRGKRESWYFLSAPMSGYIYNGCLCKNNVDCEEIIRKKDYWKMVDILPVKKGDYVYVEPGTLHALTAGSFVYEIEEGSDFTYRFFDYDRIDANGNARKLHIKKALDSLNIHSKSKVEQYRDDNWIIEKSYATKKVEHLRRYKNESSTLECFTIIQGFAVCDEISLTSGMTVLLWPSEEILNSNIDLAIISKYEEMIK